jgi:hypothetical protein
VLLAGCGGEEPSRVEKPRPRATATATPAKPPSALASIGADRDIDRALAK